MKWGKNIIFCVFHRSQILIVSLLNIRLRTPTKKVREFIYILEEKKIKKKLKHLNLKDNFCKPKQISASILIFQIF